jgi:hypothetical protein
MIRHRRFSPRWIALLLRYFVRTSTKLGYFLPINNFSDVELPQAC